MGPYRSAAEIELDALVRAPSNDDDAGDVCVPVEIAAEGLAPTLPIGRSPTAGLALGAGIAVLAIVIALVDLLGPMHSPERAQASSLEQGSLAEAAR